MELYYGSHDFDVKKFDSRSVIDEIDMVMTAFDCVLADNTAIYCSSELTTGKRLYNYLREHGFKSRDELKIRLGTNQYEEAKRSLMKENVERGIKFTENIRQRGETNLINPGPFKAQDFDQKHYLYLWQLVIIRKVYKAYFNEDWEYSNGCALEYAIATRKGIPRLDHLGNDLDLLTATAKLEHAIAILNRDGFKVEELEQTVARLNKIATSDDTSMSMDFQNDVARTG